MGVELTAVAFVAAAVVLVPGPWFWRMRNIAMLFLLVWLFAINMIAGINAIIWAGNTRPFYVAWCDIATKIIIGANFGLPACCLSTSIHLERLSSFRHARPIVYRTRARTVFDIFMCWGFPAACMALHYIVQERRFDIYEDMGCYPTWYWSVPGIILVAIIPLSMAAVSFGFTILAFTHFTRHRALTIKYLPQGGPALTKARFFRLLAAVFIQLLWSILIVLSLLIFISRGQGKLRPWTSWNAVHSSFPWISQVPRFSKTDPFFFWQYIIRLLPPIAAFSLFAFFSFNYEVAKDYLAAFRWFQRVMLRRPQIQSNDMGRGVHQKRSSKDSTATLEKRAPPPYLSSPELAYTRSRRPRHTSIQFAKISSGGASASDEGGFNAPSVYTVNINVESVSESPPPTARTNRTQDGTFLSPHWVPQQAAIQRHTTNPSRPSGEFRPSAESLPIEGPSGEPHLNVEPRPTKEPNAELNHDPRPPPPIQAHTSHYPTELNAYLATRPIWSQDSLIGDTASTTTSLERQASVHSAETLDIIVDPSVGVSRRIKERWDRAFQGDDAVVGQRWTTPSPGFDFSPALHLSPWNKSFRTISRASINAISGESPRLGDSDESSADQPRHRPASVYTLDVQLPPSLARVN